MTRTRFFILSLGSFACNGGNDTGADWSPSDFAGGSYQFTSHEVEDGCLDGAFEAVFLPEGAGTTNDWQYPIELPAWTSLPATLDVQLQEPFSTMEITVTEGSTIGLMNVASAQQSDVEFDAANNPGCLVDMGITVDIVIDDAERVHGSASMTTGSFDEDNCPTVEADPCEIELTFTGSLL